MKVLCSMVHLEARPDGGEQELSGVGLRSHKSSNEWKERENRGSRAFSIKIIQWKLKH